MKGHVLGVVLLLVCSLTTRAQEYTVRLTATYANGSNIVEEAVETLVSSGIVGNGANVLYKAGRAVYLEPGFSVLPGGKFEARIESVKRGDISVLAVRVHPNPVQRIATIEFDLPQDSQVVLGVYDTNGRLVKILLQEKRTAGKHTAEWDATDVSGGAYVYTLKTEKEVKSGRLVKQ